MSIEFQKRTGREIFGEFQLGFYQKTNRCLLRVEAYDYEWAKKEGLNIESHEILVRVENGLTEVKNGHVYMASIAKVNTKTGSIAFTKGEEGQDDFGWDRYSRANIIIINDGEEIKPA
ncbi:MAG TPA: hypothetical protein VMW10_13000 [Alphaproteobacteria bacterium]|nr:hypothetical protein [Alphaproteobacteria bacterium]